MRCCKTWSWSLMIMKLLSNRWNRQCWLRRKEWTIFITLIQQNRIWCHKLFTIDVPCWWRLDNSLNRLNECKRWLHMRNEKNHNKVQLFWMYKQRIILNQRWIQLRNIGRILHHYRWLILVQSAKTTLTKAVDVVNSLYLLYQERWCSNSYQ